MGSASSGIDVILTNPILPELQSATNLTLGQVKGLYHDLIDHTSNSETVDSLSFREILRALVINPDSIVEAFVCDSRGGEKLANVKHAICTLCIYSNAPWVSKVRCKFYLVIYSMFENEQTQALGVEEMTKLVKAVIKGVYIMTGMKFPSVRLIRDITSKAFARADIKRNMRVNIDE